MGDMTDDTIVNYVVCYYRVLMTLCGIQSKNGEKQLQKRHKIELQL